jgi:hypothetical protein
MFFPEFVTTTHPFGSFKEFAPDFSEFFGQLSIAPDFSPEHRAVFNCPGL